MSRACRICNLHRWPYRKLCGITHKMKSIERVLRGCQNEIEKIVLINQLKKLSKQHKDIIDNPEMTYTPTGNTQAAPYADDFPSSYHGLRTGGGSSVFPLSARSQTFPSHQHPYQSSFPNDTRNRDNLNRKEASMKLLERIEVVVEEVKAIEGEHNDIYSWSHSRPLPFFSVPSYVSFPSPLYLLSARKGSKALTTHVHSVLLHIRSNFTSDSHETGFDNKLRSLIPLLTRRLQARIQEIEIRASFNDRENNLTAVQYAQQEMLNGSSITFRNCMAYVEKLAHFTHVSAHYN
jgi:hypothetical protein